MTARGLVAAALAAATVAGMAATAAAEPTRSQEFFRKEILADRGTSDAMVDLLRDGGGFVTRRVTFADLTGDDRQDAVVRVHSGGAAGVVALYVFSTHGRPAEEGLKVIHRRQRLARASARVRGGVLSFRSATYGPGDELCCPAEVTETTLAWDAKRERFRVESTEPVP